MFRTIGLILGMYLLSMMALAQEHASGRVFHDANNNGQLDAEESGVAGVGVSNGRDVVESDSDGAYTLPIDSDGIVFVIKPTGWRTRIGEHNLPHFHYIHKPGGSPASQFKGVAPTGPLPDDVNFPLHKQDEQTPFDAIVFGDPQPRDEQEVHYIAHDVVEELIGADVAFGVTLGDIVFNDLAVFEPLNGVIGTIGCPWYNVLGNHDINMDTTEDRLSDETFERIYGPNYYAFNYAGVHFVVLDDVEWVGEGYHGEFGERQLEFLRNDLALVPDENLVVAMMHIPLTEVRDSDAFLAIMKERSNTFSLSAHWHRQGHFKLSGAQTSGQDGHHHLVHGTVSGSWWSGLPDEYGIPHTMMKDGTPNGYSIATFDGNDYSLRYKAARRPAEFQMSIFAPDVVNGAGGQVVANVFMGSEDSEVEMRVGNEGAWTAMAQERRPDPYYEALKGREYFLPRAAGRPLPEIGDSTHIWTAPFPQGLAPGTYVIHVRATDVFGNEHTGKRIVRVDG